MAAKTYRCTNFANCDKALTKDLIEIADGEEFSCPSGEPECQKKYLQLAGGGGGGAKGGPPKMAIVGVAAVLVLGALGYFLWPSSPTRMRPTP